MKHLSIYLFFCLLSTKVLGFDYNVVFYVSDKKTNQPIKDARVGIKETGWQFSGTDSNGKVQFSNVPVGEIHYLVTKDGYITYEGEFNVTTETKSNNVTVKLLNGSFGDKQKIFTGEVTDEAGNDMPGVTVELKISNKNFTTQTDASGNYDFTIDLDLFPPGISEYSLEVKKGNCTTREKKQLPAVNQINNNIKFTCKSDANCEGRNNDGILFKLKNCRIMNSYLNCYITIINDLENDKAPEIVFNSRNAIAISEEGKQYSAYTMKIGDVENLTLIGNISRYQTSNGTTVNGEMNFKIASDNFNFLQVIELKDQGIRCKNIEVRK